MTQEDLALPFLKILGQLSPEVNKVDGKICRRRRAWQNNQQCHKRTCIDKGLDVVTLSLL